MGMIYKCRVDSDRKQKKTKKQKNKKQQKQS